MSAKRGRQAGEGSPAPWPWPRPSRSGAGWRRSSGALRSQWSRPRLAHHLGLQRVVAVREARVAARPPPPPAPSTASASTSLARWRGGGRGRRNWRQRSSTCFSNARVLSAERQRRRLRSPAPWPGPGRRPCGARASGSDRRFSASARVRLSRPARDRQPAQGLVVEPRPVGHRRARGRPASAPGRRLSSCGRARRTRRSHGRQRAAAGSARSAASISASSSSLSSRVKNRLSAPICGRAGADVGLELGPGRIVARGRGRQAGVGADAPQACRSPPRRGRCPGRSARPASPASARAATKRALQRRQLAVEPGGRGQVGLDARIVAAAVEIVERPARRRLERYAGWGRSSAFM